MKGRPERLEENQDMLIGKLRKNFLFLPVGELSH